MKKLADLFLRGKFIVIGLAVILALAGWLLSDKVGINYNISDYLSDDTDTKKAMKIMEDEFGLTGNMVVMLPVADKERAGEIKDNLEDVENVLSVGFDEDDVNYYKDGKALYTIIIDGDDYSAEAGKVITDVKALLCDEFPNAQYAGTAVEKANQKSSITGEIVFITALCIALAYIILVFTTNSWLEPILFLLTAGVAVLINKGSNLIFGEISYVTNSISAILQLALAMDYSIILLHMYHRVKADYSNHKEAMAVAVSECVKPVSASAMTTVAGLLALLFMSFTIGFDIGIVLMKGIVISAIVAYTLFPCVILLFDKVLDKCRVFKHKNQNNIQKKYFIADFSSKYSKIIMPIVALIIIGAFVAQSFVNYTFSDGKAGNSKITSVFGNSNTVILTYRHGEGTDIKQDELIEYLQNYKTADGKPVLKNYTSYSNTVLEAYDEEKIVKELDVSADDARKLLTMYNLYAKPDAVKMSPADFLSHADSLVRTDSEAIETVNTETALTIKRLAVIYDALVSSNTAEEFQTKLTGSVMEGFVNLDLFSIKQLYGLYAYENIADSDIDFYTMVDYTVNTAGSNSHIKGMISAETVASLTELRDGIKTFDNAACAEYTPAQFSAALMQNYGINIPEATVNILYSFYATQTGNSADSVAFIEMMKFLSDKNFISDEAQKARVISSYAVYEAIHRDYSYDKFLPAVSQIAEGLTGTPHEISFEDEYIQQLYILYFYDNNLIPETKITGNEFVKFTLAEYDTNPVIKETVTEKQISQLRDLTSVNTMFSDSGNYSYIEMCDKLNALKTEVKSVSVGDGITPDKVSGVYIKYLVASEKYKNEAVRAKDLLDFVNKSMNTNELLISRLGEDRRKTVADAVEKLDSATELFIGDTYSRLILSIDLPNESENSYIFATDATEAVKSILGNNAYLAGEMMSISDLKATFGYDRLLISIFTAVSIFIIVALIFKSLSVPIILVIIIQGSIWTAMAFFAATGFNAFFMSYIVASCILMGATIDYGILMSSEYVSARRTKDKYDSLKIAISAALPTVASSGLVLTCCGFVIKLISGQYAISTTGYLLGVGAFSSVLTVMFVLPSVLYLLDKFVLKLTLPSRNGK